MLKRLIAALALIFALATPLSAIDVAPGGSGTGGGASGSGAGAGLGTTSGTTTTGFGKGWYPINSTITNAGGLKALFLGPAQVATFRRVVACGNCLAVAVSNDGGVTFAEFQTTFVAGNEVSIMIGIPSLQPRYLGYVANGGTSHIFNSTAILSSWVDGTYGGTQLNNGIVSFASNANGSTVLSSAGVGGGNITEVCRSLTQGQTFPNCTTVQAADPAGDVFYAGGTNWMVLHQSGRISRSTNDGVSFSTVTTLASGAGGGFHGICQPSASYATCVITLNGIVYRSVDNGLTWLQVLSPGAVGGICDYGSGNVGLWGNQPPIGFSTISNTVWSSQDSGQTFYAGNIYGSGWNGVGTEGLSTFACNTTGRGFAATTGTGGTFAFYNPLTQPGGVLQSSAGGYNISALIQSGVILNAAPTVSGANAAAVVTLTNTSGSRICVREIVLLSSAASAVVTLTVTDGAVIVLNYGTPATAITPARFAGSPLMCSQTGNNVVVNIGAAGGAITTTTSVIADRYPN
jgi:hypothetical protein